MAQNTALVTGATGLLGREVSKTFRLSKWNVKGTGYSRADGVDILKADLGNDADIKDVLDTTK
jgi:NAD(P)-dependent dehydrogenase (short-subunit alcohol dehydrogenase family)